MELEVRVAEPYLCSELQDMLMAFTNFKFSAKPRVLIMSYNTFRLHKEEVYASKVDLVICDEVCPSLQREGINLLKGIV